MKVFNVNGEQGNNYHEETGRLTARILRTCLGIIVSIACMASLYSEAVATAINVPPPPAGRQAKMKTVIYPQDVRSQPSPGAPTGVIIHRKGEFNFVETDTVDGGAGYDPAAPPSVFVVSSTGSGATFDVFVSSFDSSVDVRVSLFSPGSNYSQDTITVIEPPRKNDFQPFIDTNFDEIILPAGLFFENAVITRDVTIRGQGIGRTIVSGGLLGSVFRIEGDVTVHLEDMTIIDGLAYDADNNRTGSGGGIFNFGGNVTVVRCEIKDSIAFGAAGEGGAIFNRGGGTLRLIDSIVRNNEAGRNGGGISNSGINTSLLPAVGNATQVPALGLRDFIADVGQLQFPNIDVSAPTQEDIDAAIEVLESLLFGVKDTFEYLPQVLGDARDELFGPNDFWVTHGLPKMVIQNSIIERNKVKTVFLGFGGGIHNDLGLVKIDNSIIQNNKSVTNLGSFGGGINSMAGALKISDSQILNNEATSTTPLALGGAVNSFAGFVEIADSDLNDNLVNAFIFEFGGGLCNILSISLVEGSNINGNKSGGGGGIANVALSFLKVDESTISGNSVEGLIEAHGGGIHNQRFSQALITNSTISGNTGKGKTHGGGVFNRAESRTKKNEQTGQLEVTLPVFSTVTLFNTTISGNSLDGVAEVDVPGVGKVNVPLEALGAGIYNGTDKRGFALVNCLNCTIVDNQAAAGISHRGGGLYNTPVTKFVEFDFSKLKPKIDPTLGYSAITLGNTLIGDNAPEDCFSTSLIVSLGNNMDSDGTAALFSSPTDILLPSSIRFKTNSNQLLSSLQFNGGPTQTHALLAGSPVLDAGFQGFNLLPPQTVTVEDEPIDLNQIQVGDTTLSALINDALLPFNVRDQRGVNRVDGGTSWDIGAFESVPPSGTPDSYEVLEDQMLAVTVEEGVLANDIGDAVTAQIVSGASEGTVVLASEGSFTYTPNSNYRGPDSFTYQITDIRSQTDGPITVDLTVRSALDVVSISPAANAFVLPGATTIATITFDEPVTRNDVFNHIRIFGSLHGQVYPEVTVSGNQAVLDMPTFLFNQFIPGDLITLVISDSMKSAAGSPSSQGVLHQLTVAAQEGDGLFRRGSTLGQSSKSEVVLADLDFDRDLDAVAAGNGASVYINDGNGSFTATGQQFGGSGVAVGELDGDQRLDIFVVNSGSSAVWIGTGNSQFSRTSQTIGTGGRGVALGDLDGDGDTDAFILKDGPNQVWLNNGNGLFTNSGQQLGNGQGQQVRLADLDTDGDLDAFVANGNRFLTSSGLPDAVWINDGSGKFTNTQLVGSENSSGVALGDIDQDGDVDAVVVAFDDGVNRLWQNNGNGQFSAGQTLTSGDQSLSFEGVALGDLNADGSLDAFFADFRHNEFWLNDGNGTLVNSGEELINSGTDVVVGDVDGDGDIDALVTGADVFDTNTSSFVGGTHQIWLNTVRPTVAAPTYSVDEEQVLTVPTNSGLLVGATNPNSGTLVAELAILKVSGPNGALGELWSLFGFGVETFYEGVWPNGFYYTLRPSQPGHGSLNLSPDGSFTYTPNPNFDGTDSFEFTINDGLISSLPISATIMVNPKSDPPIARFDYYNNADIDFDLATATHVLITDAATGVLANDSDPDGDSLTAVLDTPPSHGTFVLNPDGSFEYKVLNTDTTFNEFDEFTYHANDGQLDSAPVRVQLGEAPITARDDFYPFTGQVVTIPPSGVLANDTDPNNGLYRYIGTRAFLRDTTTHGTLVLNTDGSFTYTPNQGPTQPDSFTYVAASFFTSSAKARVKLGNSPPVAMDDSGYNSFNGASISISAAEGVLANDSDPEGDPNLTAALATGAGNGTVTLIPDGSFFYTPNVGFSGVDSFLYRANDGLIDSTEATVTINVVNPLSILSVTPSRNAVDALVTTDIIITFDRPIIASSVNTRITVHSSMTGNPPFTINTSGAQVTLLFSRDFLPGELITVNVEAGVQGSGSTQLANFETWQFRAEVDGGGPFFTESSSSAVARDHRFVATGDLNGDGFVDAVVAPNGAAPVILINNQDGTFTERIELLGRPLFVSAPMNPVLGDFDADGDLDIVLEVGVPFGTSTLVISEIVLGLNNGSGNFSSTTELPFKGTKFSAAADFDGDGNLDILGFGFTSAWVWQGDGSGTFTIINEITLPTATASSVGDVDNDGDLDALMVGTSGGQLLINDGSGAFTAIEQNAFPTSLTDVALGDIDGDGDLDAVVVKTLLASLVALNDGSDQFRTAQLLDQKNTNGVALGDLDGDHDLDIFLANQNANQTWVNDGLGRFQSTSQQIGSLLSNDVSLADFDNDGDLDAFVANGFGDKENRVWYNESRPLAVDDFYAVSTTTVNATNGVTANDTIGQGGAITVVKDADPIHGTLILNADGSFTYSGTVVPDVFTYHLEDSFQSSRIARVKIGNTAPVANADSYFALNDADFFVNLLNGVTANDTDPEGDALTAVLNSGPGHGILTLEPDGSFIYRANPGYIGGDSFIYHVNDGVTNSGTATVSLDVGPRLSILSTLPDLNALRVPLDGNIVVTFDHPIDLSTIPGNISILGSENGPYGFVSSQSGQTLTLDPDMTFFPGEKITVIVTRAIRGTSGERLELPFLWDFTVEAPLGNGVFEDSGQRLGNDRSFGPVEMGDLDGDGDLDAFVGHAILSSGGTRIADSGFDAVWFNTNGVFSRNSTIDAVNNVEFLDDSTLDIALGDVDSDGDLDVFVAFFDVLQLLLNNGDGSFIDSGHVFEPDAVQAEMADVDGDNDLDVILRIARFQDNSFSVWLNDGTGSFTVNPLSTESIDFNSTLTLTALAIGDLDSDGDMDIICSQSFPSNAPFKVWLNDGTGVFLESSQEFGVSSDSLFLGDVDGDGDLDAFAPDENNNYVWFNQGDGTFVDSGQVYGALDVNDAALADVDADGDLDAIVMQQFPFSDPNTPRHNASTILLNDGAGIFSETGIIIGDSTLTSDNPPKVLGENPGVAIGDIDLDGDVDAFIVVREFGTASVGRPDQVWLNQSSIAPLRGLTSRIIEDDDVTQPFSNIVVLAPSNIQISWKITLDSINKGSFTAGSLSASGFTGPTGNSYSLSASSPSAAQAALRQLVFSPVPNRVPVDFSEITTFTVEATTDDSPPVILTDSSTTVESISVNDPPLAVDDSGTGFITTESTTFTTADVLNNDTDLDPSDTLTLDSFDTMGTFGLVTSNNDGTFNYDPNGQFATLRQGEAGTDVFTYTIKDNGEALATAQVEITINGQNQAPVAVDDAIDVVETGVHVIAQEIQNNDIDNDAGDQVNLSINSIETNNTLGLVQFDLVNGLTYAPNGAFGNLATGATATDTFKYSIVDPQGQVSANFATVTVTITGQNQPPTAKSDQISVTEDDTATNVSSILLSNDTDPDPNETLTLIDADPSDTIGKVIFQNGIVTYDPSGAFDGLAVGEVANDTFGYTIRDAQGATAQGTAIVTVSGQNDPPVPGDDFPLVEDDQTNVDLTTLLLANDKDPDNNETGSLAISGINAGSASGTVTFSGGTVSYTPDPNLGLSLGEGTSDTFEYTLTDIRGASVTGNVTVLIIGVNNPPVADDDMVDAIEDTQLMVASPGVLDGDTDSDGDALSAILDTTTSNGTLVLNSDGSFTYDPNQDFCGSDSFTYFANDGQVNSNNVATVSITIACVNDAPSFTANNPPDVNEDAGPQIASAASAFSPGPANESSQVVAAYIVSNLVNGNLLSAGPSVDNNGELTYTPADNAFGTVTFDLQVQDDGGTDNDGVDTSIAQTVTITINAVNDAPVADDDAYNAIEDIPLVVNAPGVLEGDTDVDGDTLSVAGDTTTSHGTLLLNANGSFTYNPDTNYCGPDSFTYHTTDGPVPIHGAPMNSGIATVTLTVDCVNDSPVVTSVTPDSQTVDYSDGIQTVTITAEDSDSTILTLSKTGAPNSLLAPNLVTCTTVANDSITDGVICSWTLDGQVTNPEALYNIDFTATDDDSLSSAANLPTTRHELNVLAEESTIFFDDSNPVGVQVATPGGDSGEITLKVSVVETLPDLPDDGSEEAGDIGLAVVSMELVPVGPGSSVSGDCIPDSVVGTSGYDTALPVTCTFHDVPVNTYTVETTVNLSGYYAGFDEDVLTVYDPSLGFASGGGWFYWPGTEDPETGYAGDKTNFGFTMKYGKKGRNVKGNLLLIRHLPDDLKFRVKSNALGGLAVGDSIDIDGPFGWATFSGKSTYLSPDMEEPEGNHGFVVYVEDRNEPGNGTDQFWIEVLDKNGDVIWDLSIPREAVDNAEPIQGGNIVAPH